MSLTWKARAACDFENDVAYDFEERFFSATTKRRFRGAGAGKQMYTTRATRIELRAREDRTCRVKGSNKNKKPTRKLAGRKNRRNDAKKVRLDFHKVKKVVDPETSKANKAWNMARKPRDTRPWMMNTELF